MACIVPALFIYSCNPEQLNQKDAQLKETTITLEAKKAGPCNKGFEVSTQWCVHPQWGGMFWNEAGQNEGGYLEEECLNPYFIESFNYQTATWSFRSTIPVCTDFFEVTGSDCGMFYYPYFFEISQTYNYWEGRVQFSKAFADCAKQFADNGEMWCFDITFRVDCP